MKQRIITGLIVAPIVLAFIYCSSPLPLLALATICVFFAASEVWEMVLKRPSAGPGIFATIFAGGGWAITQQKDVTPIAWGLATALFASVALLLASLRQRRGQHILLPAIIWITAPLAGLLLLHSATPKQGDWWPSPVLLVLLPVWIGDIAAILVGRSLGRRRLWPEVSPKKTWEGTYANIIGSTVAGTVIAPWIGFSVSSGLLCGLMAGLLGPLGDLLESAFKRKFDAKDSGRLLPGHGGLLDRLDSILLPAIPITLILLLMK